MRPPIPRYSRTAVAVPRAPGGLVAPSYSSLAVPKKATLVSVSLTLSPLCQLVLTIPSPTTDFLRVKKIPLRSYAYLSPELEKTTEPEGIDDDAQALTDTLRTSVRSDRALYDFSVLALVSFVRAYSKHEASFIFRDLEVHEHARCYGLLRLPRMPEATSGRTPRLALNEEIVDLDTLAFADPQREKQRQVALEKKRSDPTPPPPPKVKKDKKEYEAWSKQKERKEKREIRRTKKERKRAFLARQKEEEEEQQELDKQEEDDWAQEEREAKRAKRSAPQPALSLDLEGF